VKRPSALVLSAFLSIIIIARGGGPAAAQQAPIAYPGAGQSMEQQAKDESDCRNIATQASGVSPYSTAPEYYSGGYSGPGLVGGAARGAALGAVGGAIAGDAGKGAAIGAAVGGTAGVMRRNQQRRQQAQANQQAYNDYEADLARYNQSFAACMSSRNYVMR
jgi:hypothetical protein